MDVQLHVFFTSVLDGEGPAVAQLVEALRYNPEGRGFDSRWVHWNFSLTLSFRPHYDPGVDSASNRNEYQQYFLGGKRGRCLGLTLPPSRAVLKSGSLNLLEPSGPVLACNGIALPLPFIEEIDSCVYDLTRFITRGARNERKYSLTL